jgi:uncharacterized membrane protein
MSSSQLDRSINDTQAVIKRSDTMTGNRDLSANLTAITSTAKTLNAHQANTTHSANIVSTIQAITSNHLLNARLEALRDNILSTRSNLVVKDHEALFTTSQNDLATATDQYISLSSNLKAAVSAEGVQDTHSQQANNLLKTSATLPGGYIKQVSMNDTSADQLMFGDVLLNQRETQIMQHRNQELNASLQTVQSDHASYVAEQQRLAAIAAAQAQARAEAAAAASSTSSYTPRSSSRSAVYRSGRAVARSNGSSSTNVNVNGTVTCAGESADSCAQNAVDSNGIAQINYTEQNTTMYAGHDYGSAGAFKSYTVGQIINVGGVRYRVTSIQDVSRASNPKVPNNAIVFQTCITHQVTRLVFAVRI